MLLNPWIIIGVLIAFGLAVAGAYNKGHTEGVQDADAKWIKQYADLETKKNAVIAEATQRYIDSEAANLDKTQGWERKDNEREEYVQGLRLANGRLVDATCGMFNRDGRQVGSGGADSVPTTGSAPLSSQGYPAICRLPEEIRELVQRFGRGLGDLLLEADLAASEAISGHDLAVEVDAFREKNKAKLTPPAAP